MNWLCKHALVDLELELAFQEVLDAFHDPFSRTQCMGSVYGVYGCMGSCMGSGLVYGVRLR